MRTMARGAMVGCLALVMIGLAAPSAQADTVSGLGTTSGNRYRGGDPTKGGVYFASSVQVNRDGAGHITKVRGAARITKIRGVAVVQVDRLALGTSSRGVAVNSTPANSGTAVSVISYTGWVAVAKGTCISYRVRSNYSLRWSDGARSTFSILSPLTRVCGAPATPPPPPPPPPSVPGNPGDSKNCSDFATYAQAYAWFRTYYPYYGDVARLDADDDGIPCESLPGAP